MDIGEDKSVINVSVDGLGAHCGWANAAESQRMHKALNFLSAEAYSEGIRRLETLAEKADSRHKNQEGLRPVLITQAGVDPEHTPSKCDYCQCEFPPEGEDGPEWIDTCSQTESLRLCEKCYLKAGSTVR